MSFLPINLIRDMYAEIEIRWRASFQNKRYSAPIRPFKLFNVDPNRINKSMTSFNRPKRSLAAGLKSGNWDRKTSDFTDQDGDLHFHVYESFKKHFLHDVEWEETKFYERCVSEITRGNKKWGCESVNDIKNRCAYLDELYEDIKKNGYKTQSELAGEYDNPRFLFKSYTRVDNEVAVNIGRNGEFIFYDGRNRLAISKLLELDYIPVVVLVRHQQWQNWRDLHKDNRLSRGCLKNSIEKHPDIQPK